MADIASIAAGLNAVKLAFSIAKDLKEATVAFNEAEFRLKLSELYLNLSDARMNLAEAQQEINALQEEVASLRVQLNTVDELVFRDGFYYRVTKADGKPNGPFCPKCYEGTPKKLSSVMAATGIHSHFGRQYCHACQSHF
ncbi:hypothetical protein [Morganella morganii]|uniref:hypothetical protein n=1 Tax=Morganella morganii TaxID=582 RepID=UPI001BD9E5B0|nr:hypothetical protein [Morganella morganii]ELT0452773.1 hypothetical protein [Morganella morganii]EME4038633.1 hypothetical protein [Morganella morganii]MBT0335926.1 hypothetical protein [Morganella morganii subsp. morganii]